MKLSNIIEYLDNFFNIEKIPTDMPFSMSLPARYDNTVDDYKTFFTNSFLKNFHGLMIENDGIIDKIYTTVFLSEEILDKIFLSGDTNLLIFSHHPMDMESSGRGFLPLRREYLEEMKKKNIAVYVLHTPLDISDKISTSRSIANKLNLQNIQPYNECSIGFAGIYGTLPNKIEFEDFLEKMKELFGLQTIDFVKKSSEVYKIGVIAGGGADVEYIKETIDLGCDTYLSGDFRNNVKNDYSMKKREEYEKIKDSLNINLVGCSHYATEKIVIKNEITDLLKKFVENPIFVEQNDPWH